MNMISIPNLTKNQVRLLDEMWNLDTKQDYDEWYDNQPTAILPLIHTLQELLILETIDKNDQGIKQSTINLLSKYSLVS